MFLLYFKERKKLTTQDHRKRLQKIMIVNPQESKCRRMKSRKKSMKKSILKRIGSWIYQSRQDKWGYQNLQIGSCRQDNPIEGKTGKKKFNFKKNWILKDNKKG